MSLQTSSSLQHHGSGAAAAPPARSETGLRCGVCGNTEGNAPMLVREMMFGFRHEFDYFECPSCGCLQIKDIPKNLSFYYPPEYFPKPEALVDHTDLPPFLRRQRTDFLLGRPSFFGRRMVRKYGRPTAPIFGHPDYFVWLQKCGVTRSSHILDVGCGLGILLKRLQKDGFKHLTGVDPYLDQSVEGKGLRLLKQEIYDLQEQFDLIMLHHTFEHMPEPKRVFTALERLLKPGSYALLRIPVAGCYAHRKYGADWAQLDAPRHLFLHTPRSIQILAAGAGLELRHTAFDSDGFQFWASEQYVKDIPLRDPRSLNMNPVHRPFSPEEIAAFDAHAAQLNAAGEGDSACFYLFKPTEKTTPPLRPRSSAGET
jgi:SAM-dependent methyltransferase